MADSQSITASFPAQPQRTNCDFDDASPFTDAFDPWLESRKPFISSKTFHEYKLNRKPLVAFFGRTRLREIMPWHFRQYQQLRLQTCGPTGINHECSVLQQILKRVGQWKHVVDDYQPLPLPRVGPGKSLTEREESVWFAAAAVKAEWRVAYLASLLSINTSAGPAEILNLRREQVCLDEEPAEIRIVCGTKNAYRIRHVPLNERARWAAQQLLDRGKTQGAVSPGHYLIPFRNHRSSYDPLRPATSWKTAHLQVCAASNVKMRIYDFRHTCITRMLEAGVPNETVRAVCGHVSEQMTRRYSHIQMQSKLRAVRVLAAQPEREGLTAGRAEKKTPYLRIMINCPDTNRLVHTGMATEEKAFRNDMSTYASSFACPECRQIHSWTKNEALLLS